MRLAATILTATVAIVGLAVLGLFVWLRTYAPLSTENGTFGPGAGLGADVEPTYGSGGRTVFIPAYVKGRPFDTSFTVENTGRFAVTLLGVQSAHVGPIYAASLYATDTAGSAAPSHLHPFQDLRLDPKDSASVVVQWRLDCKNVQGEASTGDVRLRYRYLSMFTRTQEVELPFAVTLRCSSGPPSSP